MLTLIRETCIFNHAQLWKQNCLEYLYYKHRRLVNRDIPMAHLLVLLSSYFSFGAWRKRKILGSKDGFNLVEAISIVTKILIYFHQCKVLLTLFMVKSVNKLLCDHLVLWL